MPIGLPDSIDKLNRLLEKQQKASERHYTERMEAYDVLFSAQLPMEAALNHHIAEFEKQLLYKAKSIVADKKAGKDVTFRAREVELGFNLVERVKAMEQEYNTLLKRTIAEIKTLDNKLRKAKKTAEWWQKTSNADVKNYSNLIDAIGKMIPHDN